ncbi:hypothetical protein ONZ45_g2363 [Pleurotus djamor]|nr:hypothetical protein ONZ45_g2363 [Pleurotus djamor]
MYHDNTKDADVEIELENEPFLSHSKLEQGDNDDFDKTTALQILLYIGAIVLLSFSCFTSIHILLTPPPVEPLLEYELVKFHTGFFDEEEPSVFDGPSTDAMDDAWRDLYDIWTYAISSLTEEENNRLADPTVPVFGNHSELFGGLDVFHQLHCLDYVRQAIEPERYGGAHHHVKRTPSPFARRRPTTDLPHVSDTEHVAHCIDMVRQSLMCSADISIVSWYMPTASPGHKPLPLPRFDQTRMCRNFDKLRDWAKERTPAPEALERVMPHGH